MYIRIIFYIGGYNDPMLDLAEIGNKADFHLLYQDLKNPACLNRMDKNGNIELINDDGFGAASTQYLWRFSEYNNNLLLVHLISLHSQKDLHSLLMAVFQK